MQNLLRQADRGGIDFSDAKRYAFLAERRTRADIGPCALIRTFLLEEPTVKMETKSAIAFLTLALLAFCGLGLEIALAFGIEPVIYGVEMRDWSSFQNILHWVFTCVIWTIVIVALIIFSNRKLKFDPFKKERSSMTWQWMVSLLIVIIMLGISYWDWKGFKVLKEFKYHGMPRFVFQYLYYIVETGLVYLMIAFSQKAGELLFKVKRIPYGGIFTALTWGLVHILTKGDVLIGLLCLLSSILFGVIYLLMGKDARKAFPLILIAFVF